MICRYLLFSLESSTISHYDCALESETALETVCDFCLWIGQISLAVVNLSPSPWMETGKWSKRLLIWSRTILPVCC